MHESSNPPDEAEPADFRILGCLDVCLDGRPINLSSSKQAVLLALGLVNAGHVLSVRQLVDALWGDDPPPTATALVHTYVSGLRKLLHRPGRPSMIVTHRQGYLVRLSPQHLDAHRFQALLGEGRDAADRGEDIAAVRLFKQALGAWRGPALSGLDSVALEAEAARLDELRLVAIQEWVAASLRVGRAGAVVPDLTAFVAANPLHEGLRARLMQALHLAGRRAQALAIYQQGWRLLREQLGVEPARSLQVVHEEILRNEMATSVP